MAELLADVIVPLRFVADAFDLLVVALKNEMPRLYMHARGCADVWVYRSIANNI